MSSRNSSILLISVLTSPLKVTKGGCVPGARLCRSAGFLKGRHTKSEPSSESISALLGWIFQGFPPSQVDGGDIEHDPFEPEDHEKTLRERTVADAFSITACLCGGEGGVGQNTCTKMGPRTKK